MPSKNVSMLKNNLSLDNKIMPKIAQFYKKLPEEVINSAINNLGRDERRNIKKEKNFEKKILIALEKSPGIFIHKIYESHLGGMISSPDASYEEIMASYNGENCIMNTILIFEKLCNSNDKLERKDLSDFLKSPQFNKTLENNYNNYNDDDIFNENMLANETRIDSFTLTRDSDIIQEPFVTENVNITEIPEITEPIINDIPQTEKNKSKSAKKKSTEIYYIGYIERRETYYNFAPQYQLIRHNSKYELVELHQVAEKFPPNGTINLSYNRNGISTSQKSIEKLDLNNIFAISFDEDALEENISYSGEIHGDVNLKIDLQKEFDTNRNSDKFFKKINELQIYRIAEPEEFIDDNRFIRDYIQIDDEFASGELVLLRRKKDDNSEFNDISGPYKVYKDNKTFIQPKIEKQGYWIKCYNEEKLSFGTSERQEFNSDPVCTQFALIEGECSYKKDIIPDKILIQNIFSEISKDFINIIKKQPDEIVNIMNSSIIVSRNIPDDIKNQRLKRIRSLFSDIKNYTNEQKEIANTYIEAYCDDEKINEKLSEIFMKSQKFKEFEKKYTKPTKTNATESAKIMALAEKNGEIAELNKKISELKEQYSLYNDIEHYKTKKKILQEEISELKHKNNELKVKIKNTINEQLNETKIAFDPYISHTMIEAASKFHKNQEMTVYSNAVKNIMKCASECCHMGKNQLCEYLVNYIKQYRNYSTNDIINMYICITQGFITIFSGLPGTGKTSICNIIGNSLGLKDFENGEINYNRFVPVSVEKGWSSKKDLIGYYNPLTQKYDKNNRHLYDSLMILNEEKDNSQFPYLVLLDEANLSPMEYYWADFMQISDKCDDCNKYINIGLNDDIYIPDTLRFVATINNDQTTESLSPRLIDRAWIIKLPVSDIKKEIPCPAQKILWQDLYETFGKVPDDKINNESLLTQIFKIFQNSGMIISPRAKISMYNYILTARGLLKGNDSEVIAIDYAIMQRLLPKINGHIKLYSKFFDELTDVCSKYHLDMTKKAIENIKDNSSKNMGYCQYLS